jgi:hypothetical protein
MFEAAEKDPSLSGMTGPRLLATQLRRRSGGALMGTPESIDSQSALLGGARFFDRENRDRGWARNVTRRSKPIGKLTILDVEATEESLARFLASLDRSALVVHCTEMPGASFEFAWASGYENGPTIRIQGWLVRT